MAVDSVNKVDGNASTPTQLPASASGARLVVSEDVLSTMTAAEIMNGYNTKNWAVPDKILTWAQTESKKDPASKTTYGQSEGGAKGATESDAVAYKESLDEQGMSLKDQCKQFTDLSAQKETRDLGNVTKMAPYTQEVPTDQSTGTNGESAVNTALSQIAKDSFKGGPFNIKGMKEGMKFFNALKQGTSNELGGITESLSEMQAVISETLDEAKESKEYGAETITVGKEMKSHTKWWQFFGSRRKAANNAIEQGNKTIVMSQNTTKLAEAIEKDNSAAFQSVNQNQQSVASTEAPTTTPVAATTTTTKKPDDTVVPPQK